eukprot:1201602-Rhodomonas_salina.1
MQAHAILFSWDAPNAWKSLAEIKPQPPHICSICEDGDTDEIKCRVDIPEVICGANALYVGITFDEPPLSNMRPLELEEEDLTGSVRCGPHQAQKIVDHERSRLGGAEIFFKYLRAEQDVRLGDSLIVEYSVRGELPTIGLGPGSALQLRVNGTAYEFERCGSRGSDFEHPAIIVTLPQGTHRLSLQVSLRAAGTRCVGGARGSH